MNIVMGIVAQRRNNIQTKYNIPIKIICLSLIITKLAFSLYISAFHKRFKGKKVLVKYS